MHYRMLSNVENRPDPLLPMYNPFLISIFAVILFKTFLTVSENVPRHWLTEQMAL